MILISRENLDDNLIKSLKPGVQRNWDETGHECLMDLDIDWDVYKSLDEMGLLYVFIAYEAELHLIAGFLFYMKVLAHPHDRKLSFAMQDTFYVEPYHRKKGVCDDLLSFAENYLRSDGVGLVSQAAVPGTGFNKVLVAKGYEHAENTYLKRL